MLALPQRRACINFVSTVATESETQPMRTSRAACHLLSMMYGEEFASIATALRRYTELEQRNQADDDAALVITSSDQDISRAFPNYTSNISEFLGLLLAHLRT